MLCFQVDYTASLLPYILTPTSSLLCQLYTLQSTHLHLSWDTVPPFMAVSLEVPGFKCVSVLPAFMSVYHIYVSAQTGQKRAHGPLELESDCCGSPGECWELTLAILQE